MQANGLMARQTTQSSLRWVSAKRRVVEFYRTQMGEKPVRAWLNELPVEKQKSVAMGLMFFEAYPEPIVPKKLFEKVKGSDSIWEIKLHHGDEQIRLLSFLEENSVIIAAVGVAKKSQKLKKQDIELAEARRKAYFARRIPRGPAS